MMQPIDKNIITTIKSIFLDEVIVNWLYGIPALFFFLFVLLRSSKSLKYEYSKKGSRVSDLLAYELTCLLIILYLVTAGIIGWFELFDVNIEEAKSDPFFGRSTYVISHLISPLAAYQWWNFLFCLIYRDVRTAQMLMHHFLAFILSLCGLDGFLNYWAIFFFGITEISSVPLTIMNILKYCNRQYESSAAYKSSQIVFAFSFICVRLLFWPYYYIHCILQATGYFIKGDLCPLYFYVFATISTTLTILQLFWGSKLIKKILFKRKSE